MSGKRSTAADEKSQRIANDVHPGKSMRDRGGTGRRSPVTGHSPAATAKCNPVPVLHSELPGGQSVGFVPGSFPGGTIPGLGAWDFPFLFPPASLMPAVFPQQFMHHGAGSIFPPPVLPPNFLPPPLPFAALYPSPGPECDVSSGAWSGHGAGSRNTSSLGSSSSEGDIGTLAAKADSRVSRQFSPGLLKPTVARKAHQSDDVSAMYSEENDVPLALVVARRENVSRGSSTAESVVCVNDNVNCSASAEQSRTPSLDGEGVLQNTHESGGLRETSAITHCETSSYDCDPTVSADGNQTADECKTAAGDESKLAADAAARAKIALPPRKRLTRTAEELETVLPGPESTDTGAASSPSSAPNFRTVWKKFAAKSNVVNGPSTHRIFGSKPMYDCRTFFQKLAESKAAAASKAFMAGKGKGYFHRAAGKTSPRTADNASSPRVTRSQSKPKKSSSPKDASDDVLQAPVRKSTRKKSANTRYEEYDSIVGKGKKIKSGTGSADNSLCAESDKDVINLSTGDETSQAAGVKCSSIKPNRKRGKRVKGDHSDASAIDDGKSSSHMSLYGDDTQQTFCDVAAESVASVSCGKLPLDDREMPGAADIQSVNSALSVSALISDTLQAATDDMSDAVSALPPKFRHFKTKVCGLNLETTSAKISLDTEVAAGMCDQSSVSENVCVDRTENQFLTESSTGNEYVKEDTSPTSDSTVEAMPFMPSKHKEEDVDSLPNDSVCNSSLDFSADRLKAHTIYAGGRKSLLYRQMAAPDLTDESAKSENESKKDGNVPEEVLLPDKKNFSSICCDSMDLDATFNENFSGIGASVQTVSHAAHELDTASAVALNTNRDLCETYAESYPRTSSPVTVHIPPAESDTVASQLPVQLECAFADENAESQKVSRKPKNRNKTKNQLDMASQKSKHTNANAVCVESLPLLNCTGDQQHGVLMDCIDKQNVESVSTGVLPPEANSKESSEMSSVNHRLLNNVSYTKKRLLQSDKLDQKVQRKKRRPEEVENLVELPEKDTVRLVQDVSDIGRLNVDASLTFGAEPQIDHASTPANSVGIKSKIPDSHVPSFRPYLDSSETASIDDDDSKLVIDEKQQSTAAKSKTTSRLVRISSKSHGSRRSCKKGTGDDAGPPLLEKSGSDLLGHAIDVVKSTADENSIEPPLLERLSNDLEVNARQNVSRLSNVSPALLGCLDSVYPERPSSRSSCRTDRSHSTERTSYVSGVLPGESVDKPKSKTKGISGSGRSSSGLKPGRHKAASNTDGADLITSVVESVKVRTKESHETAVHAPLDSVEGHLSMDSPGSLSEPATVSLLSKCKSVSVVLEKMNSSRNENASQGTSKRKHERVRAVVPSAQPVEETQVVKPIIQPDAETLKSDSVVECQFSEQVPCNAPLEKLTSSNRRVQNERIAGNTKAAEGGEAASAQETHVSGRRKYKNKISAELKSSATEERRAPTPVSIILQEAGTDSAGAKLNGSQSGVKLLIKLPAEPDGGASHSRRRKQQSAVAKTVTVASDSESLPAASPQVLSVSPTSEIRPIEACVDGRRVKLKFRTRIERPQVSEPCEKLEAAVPVESVGKPVVPEVSKKSEYEFSDDLLQDQSEESNAGVQSAGNSKNTGGTHSIFGGRRRQMKVEGIRSRFLKLHQPTVVEPAPDHVICKLVKVGRQKWMSVAGEDGDDSSMERAPSLEGVSVSSVRPAEDDTSMAINSTELITDISARRITESRKSAIQTDNTVKVGNVKTKNRTKQPKDKSAVKQPKLTAKNEKQSLQQTADGQPPKRRRGRPPKSETVRPQPSFDAENTPPSAGLQPSPVSGLPPSDSAEHRWRQATTETIGGVPWLDGDTDSIAVRTDLLFGNDSFQTLAAEIDVYRLRNEAPSGVRSSQSSAAQEPTSDLDNESMVVVALPTQSTFFIPSELERLMNALDINGDARRPRTAAGPTDDSRVSRTKTDDEPPRRIDMSAALLSDVCFDEAALDQLLCQPSAHQHWTRVMHIANNCLDSADDDCLVVAQEPPLATAFEPFDAPIRLSDDEFSITSASFRDTPLTCFADLIF